MAKFSFMEYATQHGFLSAVMAPRVAKSREYARIDLDPKRGRVYQLYKTANPGAPFFEYVIPERESTESTAMWRKKVEGEVTKAWNKMVRVKEAEREARMTAKAALSGAATTAPSVSPPSSPIASSTDAPQKTESLNGKSEEKGQEAPGSVQELSTPESLLTEPRSSKASASPSRKSASKSRS